jgi:hypothetical protein
MARTCSSVSATQSTHRLSYGIVLLASVERSQAVHMVRMHSPGRSYPRSNRPRGADRDGHPLALAQCHSAILPGDKISLQSGAFDAFGAITVGMGWRLADAVAAGWSGWNVSGVFAWLGTAVKAVGSKRWLAADADHQPG